MIERCTIHQLQRRGASELEFEDAVAGPIEEDWGERIAIADGATESAFAKSWAFTLAECAAKWPLDSAVLEARQRFGVIDQVFGKATTWWAEAKLAEGAHATVLAVDIHDDQTWAAEAVGDCVVMQLSNDELVRAWPIDDPSAFGDRPALVSSLPEAEIPAITRVAGRWSSFDILLLATDALAAYLLEHDPAEALRLDEEGFEAFVEEARRRGMRNDDVTLVEIHLP